MKTSRYSITDVVSTDESKVINSRTVNYSPGLWAIFSIKQYTVALETDYAVLFQLQNDLEAWHQQGYLLIKETAEPEVLAQWNLNLKELSHSINSIQDTLQLALSKMENKEKDGYTELWNKLAVDLADINKKSKKAIEIGLDLLPDEEHSKWQREFAYHANELIQRMTSHVDSCRVLIQMVERFTPDELQGITLLISKHIPPEFTYEEAIKYEKDYYKALIDFKEEFKEEKNLWDTFLDILAGGTHQSPSERIMMERWLNGEKGNL
jgi:hypothetical protein